MIGTSEVELRRSASGNTLILRIRDGGSVSRLYRALQSAKLGDHLTRDDNNVYVPFRALDTLVPLLSGWTLGGDAEILRDIKHRAQLDSAHAAALRILARVNDAAFVETQLTDLPEKSTLDNHQQQAVSLIAHPEVLGVCLFDEQGLGKTITALFSYHLLRHRGLVTSLLVIAPKSMILEWRSDCERFFGNSYRIEVIAGATRDKRAALDRPADLYVTNYETVVSLRTRLCQLCDAARGRLMLVVDESFLVKGAAAARTRAIQNLRQRVDRCLVLCGTPAPNSPHDVIEQFNLADGGATFRGLTITPDREAALAEVTRVISGRGVFLRRLKQVVMPDLPHKHFEQVLIPLAPRQAEIYRAALASLRSDVESVNDTAFRKSMLSFAARRAALLQVCSHPIAVVKEYDETPAKLVALDALLADRIGRHGDKVVVWSFFTASLEAILRRYSAYGPVRFDGKVTDPAVRREAIRKFQEDSDTRLFVANPAAAGAGITLHRARVAVYESLSNQAAHYLQSLDRIHRRGQTRDVEYIVLTGDRTIEVLEYNRLSRKEDASRKLLGDAEPTHLRRDTFLAELEQAEAMLRRSPEA